MMKRSCKIDTHSPIESNQQNEQRKKFVHFIQSIKLNYCYNLAKMFPT